MQLPFDLPELTLPAGGSLPPEPRARIYCNRSLRLDLIEWVGFDMDYTLVIYDQAEMDRLSIEATVQKLVERGYPERLLSMEYRTDFPIRGLLVDAKLGNVVKMDRYKYVKRAYHGMRELSRDERRHAYHTRRLKTGTSRYHWVDTLYALSEVAVFAAAVQCLDEDGGDVDYEHLFRDVRACIDLAHQDGSILDHVLADPRRYVRPDPFLPHTLHRLRSAGKKLFLLTNSQPAYTERMMTFLFEGSETEYPSWRNFFDIVVTAAKKPSFFTKAAPFELVLGDGARLDATRLERGKLYAGGNLAALDRELGVTPDQVLYVGDHIYGDALRAKKETAWRTAMILQEMDTELEALADTAQTLARMDELDGVRDDLHDQLREHQERYKDLQRARDAQVTASEPVSPEIEAERVRHRRAIDRLRARLKITDQEHTDLEESVERRFHPFWGSLFKTGPEVSIFGDQVEQWACLYTAKVSNFLLYSPMHYFRSPRDRMPHEL